MSTTPRLLYGIGQWALETFPDVTERGILAHIRREADELWDNPTDAGEMADLVILICHQAARMGVDLEAAVVAKHAVNQQRTWNAPDHEGVIEHVR